MSQYTSVIPPPNNMPALRYSLLPPADHLWMCPCRFRDSESCSPPKETITRLLRCQKLQTDLSAAFDTVNHHILLSTLSELGISGSAHSWIASYLAGHSYQVKTCVSACLDDIST
ncbi:hypothetical protein UPYG_G00068870 [Umbra pygmaea]|uniref:Reverse transcriptase domain-containing protein n=1 Tax=Umbra pygmaea TaxID=75934 RepID=A0ABD0XVT6_UMBPY